MSQYRNGKPYHPRKTGECEPKARWGGQKNMQATSKRMIRIQEIDERLWGQYINSEPGSKEALKALNRFNRFQELFR